MGFFTAVRFLTIFPIPGRKDATAEELGNSLTFFPLVGLGLGLILLGLDYALSVVLPLFLVNILIITALIIFTGAHHFDGFIDTLDGIFGGKSPQERLEIMTDSRVGTFGVAGGCLLLLLKFASLSSIPEPGRLPALLLMPVLSRWAMVYVIFSFPYARKQGMGMAFKIQANWPRLVVATITAICVTFAAGWQGIMVMAGLWLLILGMAVYLRSRLGGLTGDTYGAINELAEVLVLLGFVLL